MRCWPGRNAGAGMLPAGVGPPDENRIKIPGIPQGWKAGIWNNVINGNCNIT